MSKTNQNRDKYSQRDKREIIDKLERDIRECKLCQFYYGRPISCLANQCVREDKSERKQETSDKCYLCTYRRGDPIWDYALELTCKNRYFTLYEAKTGVISESELIRTVKTTDREDGSTTVHVKNYTASKFIGFTASGSLTIIYTSTDARGNTTEKQAIVTIVDTGDIIQGQVDFDGIKSYARFISSKYYLKNYDQGGLENTSKWRTQSSYRTVLDAAMNNRKLTGGNWSHVDQIWVFTEEDVTRVKAYVTNKGIGSSKEGTGFLEYLSLFSKCKLCIK